MNNGNKIIKGNIFDRKKKNLKIINKPRIIYSKDGTEKGIVYNGKTYLRKIKSNTNTVKAGKTISGNIFPKKK
tara:strand:- start:515 stop:733 length:219 start_codon:yes stop_codon:yes gene_type:complete